jgi:hypothetical protein
MADPQLTPEQMQRLVEQQKKFNDESLKTEGILSSLSSILENEAKHLETSAKKVRSLNTALAQGTNITKQLNDEILKSGQRVEELEFQRSKNLALLAKARKKEDIEALVDANRKIDAQLKIENSIRGQLELLDQYVKDEERITAEKKKQNSLTEIAKKQIKESVKPLLEVFTLGGVFKALIDGAMRFNKVSVDIGKNFGYGAAQADRVTGNLVKMARSSDNVNVTLKNLAEAMNDLSAATGFVTEYSKDTLETQVMLTKQLGLTGEEAAGFYKYAVLTGKSSKDTYTNIKNSFVAMRNQLGVGIPFKAVMAEVAKTSGAIAASLGYNPERIAKAVVQVKALGSSLEQTKNQAESLLDFETSIENELKAELLTGQALNLERARALALQNDLAGVAEELVKQGMTAAKFGQMNAIAQKSYAASLGLSTDQLSEQLQKRELAIKSGKSLAQLDKEQTDEAARRQDIQTRFNAAVEKLQDLIGGLVAGPFGQLLEIITKILTNTTLLSAAMAVYIGRQTYLLTLKAAELMLTKKQARANAADAAVEAGKSASKVPVIGAVLGVAAALTAFAAFSGLLSKGDDVISPGYGKRMIFSPEGAVALNNNDTLVAGTNLGGGRGNSTDLSPLASAINDLHSTVRESASKPSVAYIQGERPFASNLGRQSQLFTSGMQNQSKLA